MGPPCRTAAEAAGKLLGSMGSPEPGAAARVPLAQPREQGGDDMARVVVVGDLMTDTVAHAALPLAKGSDTPAPVGRPGGGSGATLAAWLAADGGEVAFVGRRGADIAGRNRDMELMGYGVDARLVMDPDRPTGTCVVMVTHKGDHTMMSDPGANAALHPDDLPKDLFAPGAHLHMSGYTLLNEGSRGAALAAFAHAGRAGMTISVDGASSAPLERVGAEPFLEMTNGVTLLLVNADQAAVLTGLFSLDGRVPLVTGGSSGIGHAMARALALAGARVVLLARGEEGLRKAAAAIQSAGGTAGWVRADLADPAAAQRAAEETA